LCCRNLLLLAAALLLIHCKSGSQTRGLANQEEEEEEEKHKLWTQTETHQLEKIKIKKLSGFSGFPFRILLFQANMGFPS
jgi:hypothetical protein